MDYATSYTERTEGFGQPPKPKVILFDLWKTLTTSHCVEPIHTLQRILGHRFINPSGQLTDELDDRLLRACLTTDVRHPHGFVATIAQQFNRELQPGHIDEFIKVIDAESGCTALFLDVMPCLEALVHNLGYNPDRQFGIISNLWPFPAEYIFAEDGLGRYFRREHRVFSFEVGHRKPEPEIFLEAARRFGVRPEEILVVGDNLEADVVGALNVGMQAAFIDRLGTQGEQAREKAPWAIYLRSLLELPSKLAQAA